MTEHSAVAPDALWPLVQRTTHEALASGALQSITTHTRILEDAGIPFRVRLVDSLARKAKAQEKPRDRAQKQIENPFLPYEEALFVANLSSTHACLLNKFNVVDHHLLMITRDYVSQQTWLTLEDFVALARCLHEIEGLGFYNSGPAAGASQHHKHLQLIPLPQDERARNLPITTAIPEGFAAISEPQSLPTLPFQHRWQSLTTAWLPDYDRIGTELLQTYRGLLTDLGINLAEPTPTQPYNLLVTRDWMMVVGRSQPSYENIGVNSLGYAGCLLVKTPAEFEQLTQIGPLNLLTEVGLPSTEN
ncbi:MAG: phosphorylase [Cyanobacteria bacterium P01_F01_bin.56]